MNAHHLHVATEPFNAIMDRKKTIESRLCDEKRQAIQIGDTVFFTNRDNATQMVEARVIRLLKYETFHELFSDNNPAKFGGPSVAWLENQINEFYSLDSQRRQGVLGIEFEIIR